MANTLSNADREKIFGIFLKNHELKFNEIEKSLDISSNLLTYHLEQMIKEEILIKKDSTYKLTEKAEKMIPFFAHITGKEIGSLPVVLIAILNKKKDKICLLKRAKKPYQGYWGILGGKLKLEESIEETALREVKEETSLNCRFNKINSVLHERVKENNKIKHSFVFFLTTVIAEDEKFIISEEGELKWFDINKLEDEKIIPSDIWMVKNCLDKTADVKQVIIEEENQELKNMQVK